MSETVGIPELAYCTTMSNVVKTNMGALQLLRHAAQRDGALRVPSLVNTQTPTPAVLEATSPGPRTWASRTFTPPTEKGQMPACPESTRVPDDVSGLSVRPSTSCVF